MNKFQVFIDENKDILNDFAKKYIEKTDNLNCSRKGRK